jgi:hypothetical protein
MSSKRIFTDEELKEMGAPTLDLISKAIDAGDKEKAKALQSGCKARSVIFMTVIWCGSADYYPISTSTTV